MWRELFLQRVVENQSDLKEHINLQSPQFEATRLTLFLLFLKVAKTKIQKNGTIISMVIMMILLSSSGKWEKPKGKSTLTLERQIF